MFDKEKLIIILGGCGGDVNTFTFTSHYSELLKILNKTSIPKNFEFTSFYCISAKLTFSGDGYYL